MARARATGGIIGEDDYDGEFRYDRQPLGALQGLGPDHVVYAGTVGKRSGTRPRRHAFTGALDALCALLADVR